MGRFIPIAPLAVLGALFVWHSAAAQSAAHEDERTEGAGLDAEEELARALESGELEEFEEFGDIEEIEVVGTRLQRFDPTARVDVITAEEIKRRGLSTAEDVIRSLPQNVSTNNRVSNGQLRTSNPLSSIDLGGLGRGVATANLRGFGEDATLVLLNGKRIAGSGGRLGSFANLRDIPASSIERIEISYDNGSAIHGSDAIGGVINIVTKRGYTGGQLALRHEVSETGADLSRVSGYFGRSWGVGNISANFSYEESKPISTRKAGFVTRDYRDVLGPGWDYRFGTFLRAGGIRQGGPFGPIGLILPPGHNGVDAAVDDFVAHDRERDVIDYIHPEESSSTENASFTVNFKHELFENFELRADALYSEGKSRSQSAFSLSSFNVSVPATNAFSPFTESVDVAYFPRTEVEMGLLPHPTQTAETTQLHYTLGFDYELSDKVTWVTDATRSVSEGSNLQMQFLDPGILLFGGEDAVALAERLLQLVASSDPEEAINVFGDGTAQNPTIADFYGLYGSRDGKTIETDVQSYLTGEFLDLPGGEVAFVVGGEWRARKLPGSKAIFDSGITDNLTLADFLGAPPESRQWAAFSELSIPLVGLDNAVAGVRELTLIAQMRYDRYDLEGASGLDPESGAPILDQVTFDNWSPRIGLAWSPTDAVFVRLSYSEGFKAPRLTDIFSTSFVERQFNPSVFDPLLEDFVTAYETYGPNPDLKPETSENHSLGVSYTPGWAPGLYLQVDYSRVDFKDRIASGFSELQFLLDPQVFGNMPEFFVRDEDGTLLETIDRPINISRRVSETIDTDLSYAVLTDWGEFEPGLNVSYVIGMFDQAVPGAEEISFVGKAKGLDRYKAQARLNWTTDAWDANLYVNYTPGYDNNSHQGLSEVDPPVASYTTVDLTASRHFQNGLTLRAGARNLLNEDFPFCVCSLSGEPYDAQRVDLRGRVVFLEVSYDFSDILERR